MTGPIEDAVKAENSKNAVLAGLMLVCVSQAWLLAG